MKNKKIIFSIYDDIKNPYYAGGGAVAVHEIARAMSIRYDVVVINSKHPLAKKDDSIDGVNYKRIGFGTLGPKFDQVIFGLLLPLYLYLEKFDVWIETFLPPFSGSILQCLTTKPIVGVAFFLDASKMAEKYKLPFAFLENQLIKNYHYLIATNDLLKKRLKKINDKALIKTIPLGIHDSILKDSRRFKEKEFILYLGRIDIYNKGLDLLLKIAPDILKSNPRLKIVIAGSGSKSRETLLKREVKRLRLSKRILLKGFVSEKEKIKLISESMLYLFPSRYETFGIGVLEAMALGKSVIIFDIPGLSWIPDKYLVKIPAFDTQMFSDKVLWLLANPETRKKLGRLSKDFAKDFSWKNVVKRYNSYLGKVNSSRAFS